MELGEINLLAILLSSVLAFIVGAIWYAPGVFGNIWKRHAGVSEDQAGVLATLAPAFLLICIISIVMSAFIPAGITGLGEGALYGAMVGLGLVAASLGVQYLFARRSVALFVIDSGYLLVAFVIIGAVIASFA